MLVTKLIGFKIYNHYLFKDGSYFGLDIEGQNTKKNRKTTIFYSDTLILNKVTGVVGINAVGKTTLVSIFKGLSDFYLSDLSIDQTVLENVLKLRKGAECIEIEARIASNNGKRYVVRTTFKKREREIGENGGKWYVEEEKIYSDSNRRCPRMHLFDAERMGRPRLRSDLPADSMLSPKDSYFFKIVDTGYGNWFHETITTDSLTNSNDAYLFSDETPEALLGYLDNSIEYLRYNRDSNDKVVSYSLKFKGSDEIITNTNFEGFVKVLSSGTIKGLSLFFLILQALRTGATIIVDEIEIHINKQIARDFIGLFMDSRINKNNASIIYTTHYMELTNDLKRKDQEYVITRDGDTLESTVLRLNNANARTELKNSEIFEGGSISNTRPDYEKYIDLKKDIAEHVKKRV